MMSMQTRRMTRNEEGGSGYHPWAATMAPNKADYRSPTAPRRKQTRKKVRGDRIQHDQRPPSEVLKMIQWCPLFAGTLVEEFIQTIDDMLMQQNIPEVWWLYVLKSRLAGSAEDWFQSYSSKKIQASYTEVKQALRIEFQEDDEVHGWVNEQAENELMEKVIEDMKLKLDDALQTKENLKRQLDAVGSEYKSCRADKEDLIKQKNMLEEQVKLILDELTATKSKKESLLQKLTEAKRKETEQDVKIKKLIETTNELSRVQEEAEKYQRTVENSLEATNKALQTEKKEIERNCVTLQSQKNSLNEQVKALTKQLGENGKLVKEKEIIILNIQKEHELTLISNAQLLKDVQASNAELSVAKLKKESLEKQLTSKSFKAELLKEILHRTETQKQKLNMELWKHQQIIFEVRNNMQTVEFELEATKEDNLKLRQIQTSKQRTVENEVEALKNKITDSISRQFDIEQELIKATETVSSLKEVVQAFHSKREETKEEKIQQIVPNFKKLRRNETRNSTKPAQLHSRWVQQKNPQHRSGTVRALKVTRPCRTPRKQRKSNRHEKQFRVQYGRGNREPRINPRVKIPLGGPKKNRQRISGCRQQKKPQRQLRKNFKKRRKMTAVNQSDKSYRNHEWKIRRKKCTELVKTMRRKQPQGTHRYRKKRWKSNPKWEARVKMKGLSPQQPQQSRRAKRRNQRKKTAKVPYKDITQQGTQEEGRHQSLQSKNPGTTDEARPSNILPSLFPRNFKGFRKKSREKKKWWK